MSKPSPTLSLQPIYSYKRYVHSRDQGKLFIDKLVDTDQTRHNWTKRFLKIPTKKRQVKQNKGQDYSLNPTKMMPTQVKYVTVHAH